MLSRRSPVPADRHAARASLAALATFVAIVVLEHALRPDLPPGRHFVSEYGNGSTRVLQSAAFVAWAASMATAAVPARHATAPGRRIARTLTVAALLVAAGGALADALFATQTVAGQLPRGATRTTAGRLHDLGTLLILGGLLVAGLASLRLVRARRYRLAVAGLGAALVAVVQALVALGIDAPGWGQRAFIAIGCAWQARFTVAVTPG